MITRSKRKLSTVKNKANRSKKEKEDWSPFSLYNILDVFRISNLEKDKRVASEYVLNYLHML